jgi:hypothetical protein
VSSKGSGSIAPVARLSAVFHRMAELVGDDESQLDVREGRVDHQPV